MDFDTAARTMADHAGLSLRAVGAAAGRTPAYLPSVLSRGSVPSLTVAAELAAPCGYSLAFVPTASLPADALPIDPPGPTA